MTFDFRLEDTEAILIEMEAEPRLPCGACGKDPCEGTGLLARQDGERP